ncbi:MAG: tetratricopeptide repeat protein [Candidatus Thorarchaeota archaeon]
MVRNIERILAKITTLCQEEKENEAEVLVRDALVKDPNNTDLLTKLGIIQVRLCRDDEAEATFRNVLKQDRDHEEAICSLGRLLDQSLRSEEAEALYRNYLQRKPSHCAVDDLCRLLLTEDREEEALDIARNHMKKFPTEAGAYDALRYTLVVIEDKLSGELDDKRESATVALNLLINLIEQLELFNKMKQELDVTPLLERELLDEKSRVAGEIDYVLSSARIRNLSIPDEILTRIDTQLEL